MSHFYTIRFWENLKLTPIWLYVERVKDEQWPRIDAVRTKVAIIRHIYKFSFVKSLIAKIMQFL